MLGFLACGVLLVFLVGLSIPVWVLTRSWLQVLRAMAAVLFGMLLPMAVFLLSGDFQPQWKGACRLNWIDCFHVGKMMLLPVVLWAMAAFYAADVIRVDRALLHTWERWGVLNGAIVSGVCLAHLAALMVVNNRAQDMLGFFWWGLFFPLYTTVWYTYRAWRCRRLGPDPWMRSGCAVLPSLPFWIGSVLLSQHLYKQLPDVAPSCFVVTAASRGHPWLVGSRWARAADGSLQRVNAQLVVFRAAEAVWQRHFPGTHTAFRRVYNVWGYRAARLIHRRWLADVAYLLLKPLEWLARIGLRCAPGRRGAANQIPHLRRCGIWRSSSRQRLRRVYAVVVILLGLYFFLAPGVIVSVNLCDPALRAPGIPRQAWRLHRTLVPRYTAWARERIASGRAAHLELHDVPSTEWPIFGSVFYLWATEALQADWEHQDPGRRGPAPVIYARPAIDAALAVILDPAHHTWVRQHWGADYLHQQDCFFRSLLIAGVTSYTRLTGDRQHLPLLRDQVETLCATFDASPVGLLEDYPGECYPIDVVCCVACLQRAAGVLGIDAQPFVARARRAFTGRMLDPHGLPPYVADWRTGIAFDYSRGTGNSDTLIFAPELWPDLAQAWYAAYEKHFWQDRGWAAGFREYARDVHKPGTFFEIDAGPVIVGFSPAANAFGLAATRLNGRFDHAYTLGAQIVAASWPLPDGTLLGCRILSAVSSGHAPYLGETALLFHLTQNPPPGMPITRGGRLTPLVWGFLAFYFGCGGLLVWRGIRAWRKAEA